MIFLLLPEFTLPVYVYSIWGHRTRLPGEAEILEFMTFVNLV